MRERMGFILKCPKCGAENPENANFCIECSLKLRQICNCWVKGKLYKCGQNKCPGYNLFLQNKRNSNIAG